jgi:PAS domain S-box-containing protein
MAQFRRLFELSPDVLCTIDRAGRFTSVSPACLTVWGYGPEALLGAQHIDFVYPEDRPATSQVAEAIMAGAVVTAFQNRYRRSDGSPVHMIWSARWDESEGLMYCIARDATEHRNAQDSEHQFRLQLYREQEALIRRLQETEEELRRANERFRLAARTDAIYEWNILTNDLQWSEGLFELFGHQPGSFQMAAWEAELHPDDRPRLLETLAEALADRTQQNWEAEYRIRHQDGSWRHVFEKGYLVRDDSGRAERMVGRMQDITARKRYEDERQKLAHIARQTSNAVSLLDTSYQITWINPAYSRMFGYSFEEALGRNFSDLITGPDTDMELLRQFRQDLAEGREFRSEFLNYTRDGRRVHTDITGQPVLAPDGTPLYYFVMARDVTRRVEREEEFRKLSLITQQTDDGIIVTDVHKRTTWINAGFTRMTGFTLDEMRGKRPAHVLEGRTPNPELLAWIDEQYASRKPFSFEVLNYKKDGTPFWSLLSIQPLFDAQGNIVEYFSIRKDITASKQLEKELESARNRTTAAVIAAQEKERSDVSQELHDNVNQVLTTVKLYQELCLSGIGNRDELTQKSMRLLQESINEIRSLSKRLSAPSLGKIKLHESIRELTDAVTATGKLAVSLDAAAVEEGFEADSTTHIALYRILQEQLTNVLKHAGARNVSITFRLLPGRLLLEVADDGVGFDTARRMGGSGLTNIRSRAESLLGSAILRSAPGKGCTLTVSLPRN